MPSLPDPTDREGAACRPSPVKLEHFNPNARIPYGVQISHICAAMNEFIEFIGFINQQLATRKILRLECMLMAAWKADTRHG